MFKSGYTNLHYTDGSYHMMHEAKKKNIYKTLQQCFLPKDLNILQEMPDSK